MLISNFLFYIAFSVSLLFALNGDSEKKPNCIAIDSMFEKDQNYCAITLQKAIKKRSKEY